MLVTALAVLAAPLMVTGFAVAGVSVGDAFGVLGVGSPDDEPEADAGQREGADEAGSAPQVSRADDEAPGAPAARPPGASAARPGAEGGAGREPAAPDAGLEAPAAAPPAAASEPPADGPPPPVSPPADEGPLDVPLDGIDDILDDPVGGAKDALDDLKGLVP